MIDFDVRLATLRREVEICLRNALPESNPASLYDPIHYVFAGGGKRLRPMLTVFSAMAISDNTTTDNTTIYNKALLAGTAIEMLHNFTLLHDDIMDKSSLRRGRQTVHKRWNDATAIIAGDTILGLAYKLLTEAAGDSPSFKDIIACFTGGLIGVCEGQALDMEYQHEHEIPMEMYKNMISKKTAKMLEICAETGAYLGGGNAEQLWALKNYAHNLGIGFQIQDDVLDLTAVQQELGKPIGNDIIEGKKTYLIIRAQEKNPTGADGVLLERFFEQQGLAAEEVPQMHEMLERLGILDDARLEVESYAGKAANMLNILPDSDAKEMLLLLNDKLTGRRH